MIDSLSNLIQNPLIIIGGLFCLAIFFYFAFEHMHFKHKQKEEKTFILSAVGVFLIAIAVISLYTTTVHFVADSAGLVPEELSAGYYTINEMNDLCSAKILTSEIIDEQYQQGCKIIGYIFYASFSLIIIGALLMIAGILRTMMKEKKKKTVTKKQ